MTRYLQATKHHWVCLDNYKFITEAMRVTPFDIDVPFYLWEFAEQGEHSIATGFENDNGVLRNSISRYHCVHKFELNGFTVQFTNGYDCADVLFFQPQKDDWVSVSVLASPVITSAISRGQKRVRIIGVDYTVSIDDDVRIHRSNFGISQQDAKRFARISGLRQHTTNNIGVMCYGLKNTQYNIDYKGHELNGSAYALLIGTWAIILDDDLSFDSVAVLSSATADRLFVERFIYTVNPYIVKVMTLIK